MSKNTKREKLSEKIEEILSSEDTNTLKELINDDSKLEEMSKMALKDPSTGGNPIKLSQEDFFKLYRNAYDGKLIFKL